MNLDKSLKQEQDSLDRYQKKKLVKSILAKMNLNIYKGRRRAFNILRAHARFVRFKE